MKLWVIGFIILILETNFYSISTTTIVANNLYNKLKQNKGANSQEEKTTQPIQINQNKYPIDIKDSLIRFISITSLVLASLALFIDEKQVQNIKKFHICKFQPFHNVSDSSIKTKLNELKLKQNKYIDESLCKHFKYKYKALLFLLCFSGFSVFVWKFRNA